MTGCLALQEHGETLSRQILAASADGERAAVGELVLEALDMSARVAVAVRGGERLLRQVLRVGGLTSPAKADVLLSPAV